MPTDPKKPAPTQNRYVPQRSDYSTHQQWQDMSKLYQMHYDLHDSHQELAKPAPVSSSLKEGGASSTKIAGYNVKAAQAQDGQKLTFNGTTGEIEWQ